MEINDEVDIQIFHTLEQVKRMNEAIHRQQEDSEPNPFMVEQYQQLKSKLTDELQQLLSTATEAQWAVQ